MVSFAWLFCELVIFVLLHVQVLAIFLCVICVSLLFHRRLGRSTKTCPLQRKKKSCNERKNITRFVLNMFFLNSQYHPVSQQDYVKNPYNQAKRLAYAKRSLLLSLPRSCANTHATMHSSAAPKSPAMAAEKATVRAHRCLHARTFFLLTCCRLKPMWIM